MSSVPQKMSYLAATKNLDNKRSFKAKEPAVNPADFVYLWWDFENIEIEDSQIAKLAIRIEACLRSIDPSLRLFRRKYAIGNMNSSFMLKNSRKLETMGFEFKDTPMHSLTCPRCKAVNSSVGPFRHSSYITKPYERVNEIADCMIVQGIIKHVCANTGSKNVAFLTGDGDFSLPLNSLRRHGYKVFLFQKEESKEELKVSASYTWELQRIFRDDIDYSRTINRSR